MKRENGEMKIMRDDGLESKRKGLGCFVREIRYDDRKVVDKTEEKPRLVLCSA